MVDLSLYFKQKYRIPSTRLKNWNYSSNGYYFVTICTYKKNCYFGEIKNNQITLSKIGKIAEKYWLEIPKHFSFTKLDEYVIMPNHIHGIIVIDKKNNNCRFGACSLSTINKIKIRSKNVETCQINKNVETCQINKNVETCHGMSLQNNLNKFSKPISGSISIIINQYKSSVKRYCNKNLIPFNWQSSFYDHIIRNEKSLNEIRQYIKNNPLKWEIDEENPKNNL